MQLTVLTVVAMVSVSAVARVSGHVMCRQLADSVMVTRSRMTRIPLLCTVLTCLTIADTLDFITTEWHLFFNIDLMILIVARSAAWNIPVLTDRRKPSMSRCLGPGPTSSVVILALFCRQSRPVKALTSSSLVTEKLFARCFTLSRNVQSYQKLSKYMLQVHILFYTLLIKFSPCSYIDLKWPQIKSYICGNGLDFDLSPDMTLQR